VRGPAPLHNPQPSWLAGCAGPALRRAHVAVFDGIPSVHAAQGIPHGLPYELPPATRSGGTASTARRTASSRFTRRGC
jgi:hypothetical protein